MTTSAATGKAPLSQMRQALAQGVSRERISIGDLLEALGDRALARIGPWLARTERLLRPRIMRLLLPPVEYLLGLVCLLLAVVLALPAPLGSTLPALAISLLALGLLERDGFRILAGFVAAAATAVVVSGAVFALVKATTYFLTAVLR